MIEVAKSELAEFNAYLEKYIRLLKKQIIIQKNLTKKKKIEDLEQHKKITKDIEDLEKKTQSVQSKLDTCHDNQKQFLVDELKMIQKCLNESKTQQHKLLALKESFKSLQKKE